MDMTFDNGIATCREQPAEADEPCVSIVVPALNEQVTIGEFVEWCWEGLRRAGVSGEVLTVDSSTDRTGEIALEKGARVLRMPKRGLGRAYIDAIPYIKGEYVIMGDCDLTYDFRELEPFVEKLNEGYELIMGSRFKGYIEPGAMPALHRYFGTPITTWVLNLMYGTRYSDIHCGMRAITLDALKRIDLESQGWEYASEMVLKAARLKLRTCEVPVRFYKDREGRLSHHKRIGWLSPWKAGWDNLRAMFLYAPEFFLTKPGWLSFVLGLALTLSLVGGPYQILGVELNLHWMLLGLTLATLGYSALQFGALARMFYNFDPAYTRRIQRMVTYNRGVIGGIIVGLIGVVLNLILVIIWLKSGLRLAEFYHPGIFGLLLIILGFQTFTFTLLLQMIQKGRSRSQGMSTIPDSRRTSYGQCGMSIVDRFGVYLSKRAILRDLPRRHGLVALDLGCGYCATHLTTTLYPYLREGLGVDLEIDENLKQIPGLSFVEFTIEEALPRFPDEKFDLILMISVLEHIWDPECVLKQCWRVLKDGGILLINVPTWRGKFFLEYSAFRLGASPPEEMDDHKMYYDKRDLWPLLVRAGFKPSRIRMRYHKFGLNLFAVVRKSLADRVGRGKN